MASVWNCNGRRKSWSWLGTCNWNLRRPHKHPWGIWGDVLERKSIHVLFSAAAVCLGKNDTFCFRNIVTVASKVYSKHGLGEKFNISVNKQETDAEMVLLSALGDLIARLHRVLWDAEHGPLQTLAFHTTLLISLQACSKKLYYVKMKTGLQWSVVTKVDTSNPYYGCLYCPIFQLYKKGGLWSIRILSVIPVQNGYLWCKTIGPEDLAWALVRAFKMQDPDLSPNL